MDGRQRYLQAMGIQSWVSRQPSAHEPDSLPELPLPESPLPETFADTESLTSPPSAAPQSSLPTAAAATATTEPTGQLPAPASPTAPVETPFEVPATPAQTTSAVPTSPTLATVDEMEIPLPATDSQMAAADCSAMDWEALAQTVASCQACELAQVRTQTVFGVGDRQADWMIIGEAPGADEDRQGEPFVGRAGQLLNEMIKALGLRREAVYIANILKCRPPNNRDPQPEEVARCEVYLQRQIALIKPRMILAVGRIAAQNLLKTDVPIGKLRGQVHHYGEQNWPLVVTYHPAYLLRSPGEKRKSWQDLQMAMQYYQSSMVEAEETTS